MSNKNKNDIIVIDGHNIDELKMTGSLSVIAIEDKNGKLSKEIKLRLNDGRIYGNWPEVMFLGNHKFKLHTSNDKRVKVLDNGEEFESEAIYKILRG